MIIFLLIIIVLILLSINNKGKNNIFSGNGFLFIGMIGVFAVLFIYFSISEKLNIPDETATFVLLSLPFCWIFWVRYKRNKIRNKNK
jgi:Na+/melibiose symporter-like transporter